MASRPLIALLLGVPFVAAGVGCSLAQSDDTDSSSDRQTVGGTMSEILKSTVQLQGGCTAAKVGPRQLLVAARCVTNKTIFAAGKTITFTSAGKLSATASDAGADADAASKGDAAKDAGADASARTVKLVEVDIHPSYAAKCVEAAACDFTTVAASDAPDIAVLVLDADLDTVPTIPVDLDPVSPTDALLAVTSSCATFDSKPTRIVHTVPATAVPAKSVIYKGSQYEATPQYVSRVGTSYVVTAAAAWQKGAPGVCKSDIGAPLFRATTAAVAGITSNFTTYAGQRTPVTTEHTRVDAQSRFKIGAWLADLGVQTTHSCSASAGGCTTTTYDGGTPPPPPPPETDASTASDATTPDASDAGTVSDAAADADAAVPDDAPTTDQIPSEDPGTSDESSGGSEGPDDSDGEDAGTKKKEAAAKGGCSTAPVTANGGSLAFGFSVALSALAVRRRRRSR